MRNIFVLLLISMTTVSSAQTVFNYGPHTVKKEEFWRAYTKNNPGKPTAASVREYLELYIRFKLKVQAAKDLKLDTLPNLQNDIAAFRAQIAEQYMKKSAFSKELITEAAERSGTEIDAAHIFIEYNADSAAAKKQADLAWKQLQEGADFNITARNYSTNVYVKATDGYLGYISVLSLPYELENVVYALAPGTYSKPVAGSKGWHIFKVLRMRKSVGTMTAAQILFTIPPDASQEEKAAVQRKADSVYQLLRSGLSFSEAAATYSHDKFTYMNGGVLPAFRFTDFDPAFSKAAFALEKDGEFSAPVNTPAGWHIIRRITRSSTNTDLTNPEVYQKWSDQVNADARINTVAKRQKEEMKTASGYKVIPYNETQLWQLTDSMLAATNYAAVFKANQQNRLFQLKDKTVTVADWLKFVKSKYNQANSNNVNGYGELMNEFTETTIEQYYKDRLERMNPEFGYQMQEFREGSLLFEVMERTIWSVAPADSAGLLQYYNNNKTKYKWQPSVTAIIFNCADTSVANQALLLMKQNTANWQDYMDQLGGYALADSGRFEFSQLPVKEGTKFAAGTFTAVETNANDGSSSFCYIISVHETPDQRSFEEAKGLVINDYQLLLEEKWIGELKKKYPVKVNEAMLKELLK